MSGVHMSLEDLPPAMRAEAESLLKGKEGRSQEVKEVKHPNPPAPLHPSRKVPNKTEAAFRDWYLSRHFIAENEMRYEALTLRLPGGSRYTPDWVVAFSEGQAARPAWVTCFEVKGGYKLHSHGRALTAFREARAAFAWVKFHWFEPDGKGGFVEKYT